LQDAFPNLEHVIEEFTQQGDQLIVHVLAFANHQGEFQGLPPTGKSITLVSRNIFRFEGGKIVEQWLDFDPAELMRQIGVEPLPLRSSLPSQPPSRPVDYQAAFNRVIEDLADSWKRVMAVN
jgi:hypothetical protein